MKWLEIPISLVRIWINNRREFSVARKTYHLAFKVMSNQKNGLAWDESNNYSKVVIVFLVKNIHRLQSIIILCKRGLAKDAVPLLRSMFEELADLNYMSADQTRVQDFIDYDTYQRYKLGRVLANSKTEGIDRIKVAVRNKVLENDWNKIRHKFSYKDRNGEERIYARWTRGNVRQICDDVGLGEMYDYLFGYLSTYVHSTPMAADDFVLGRKGNDVGLGETYDFLFGYLSTYVHSTPMAADDFVLGKKGDNVFLVIGASPTLVAEVLGTSSGIYLDMLRIADKDFNMGLDKQIKIVEKMLNDAAAARKKLRIKPSDNT